MSTQAQKKQQETLDTEQQLLELLKDCPDILVRNPALLAELEVPHEAGRAVSLIERQVSVLRDKLQANEKRLRELMDIARGNERLAESRHRLAINLLGAHDLEDVISIVLDELSNELGADFAVMRLITDSEDKLESKPEIFINQNAAELKFFGTMLDNRKPLCGRCTDEQNCFMFGNDVDQVGSAAVIPLVAGANLGLLGLGGKDERRFSIAMGTEFLSQIGELVSAALAVHLEA
ncbi:MAG: DUF484 family protein [Gammaproteobacteria bacterium]